VIEEEGLVETSVHIGQVFGERLLALQAEFPDRIGDVRCDRGAMIAVELVENGDANLPDAILTKTVVTAAYQKGLIALTCGVRGNVFRFLPALTISDALIHEGLDIFEDCFRDSLIK